MRDQTEGGTLILQVRFGSRADVSFPTVTDA